jgi:VWFA-related protein
MKRIVFNIFIPLFLFISVTGTAAGSPSLIIDSINTNDNFPDVEVSVTVNHNQKKYPVDLNEDHFSIYEDGKRASFITVKKIEDSEDFLYLVFSIDSSKSISRDFLRNIKTAAKDIVGSTGPKDKVAIYRFNDDVIMLNSFITEKRDLVKNINSIERHGKKTMLYNAVYDSIELLRKVNHNKKAIIVFTDGKDEGSSIRESDIIEYARETTIPLYFICVRSSGNSRKLARISRLTGGRTIITRDAENIAGLYKKVLSFIKKNRYAVQYRSSIQPDGKVHKIEVKLRLNGIFDSASREVTISRNWNILAGSNSLILIILLGVIILLLIVIIIMLILYFRRPAIKKGTRKNVFTGPSAEDTINRAIEYEEEERIQESNTLLDSDPEYHYAHAWLIEKDGPATGKKYPIHWKECTIGRENDNIIQLDDNAVSPYHAKLKYIRKSFYLYDLVSENGTFLNGHKLLRPKTLYDWDEIKIGRTTLIFRGSKR